MPITRVFFTGTHDNETVLQHAANLATWNDGGAASRHISEYFGASGEALSHAVAEKVFNSKAGLAVVSIADVLKLGAEGRYNLPGTVSPDNWSKSYPLDVFEQHLPWLAAITKASGRSALVNAKLSLVALILLA